MIIEEDTHTHSKRDMYIYQRKKNCIMRKKENRSKLIKSNKQDALQVAIGRAGKNSS